MMHQHQQRAKSTTKLLNFLMKFYIVKPVERPERQGVLFTRDEFFRYLRTHLVRYARREGASDDEIIMLISEIDSWS